MCLKISYLLSKNILLKFLFVFFFICLVLSMLHLTTLTSLAVDVENQSDLSYWDLQLPDDFNIDDNKIMFSFNPDNNTVGFYYIPIDFNFIFEIYSSSNYGFRVLSNSNSYYRFNGNIINLDTFFSSISYNLNFRSTVKFQYGLTATATSTPVLRPTTHHEKLTYSTQ